jgi:hypothetical protein
MLVDKVLHLGRLLPYSLTLEEAGKACQGQILDQGARYLMGEDLEVVWAEFSMLS